MEKMLTFEEFRNSVKNNGGSDGLGYWNAARQGTIPAENAVVIPPVSEWPKWATGVRMVFEEGGAWNTPTSTGVSSTSQRIKTVPGTYIPRPKPVWVPKVGDKIFFQVDSVVGDVIAVGTISHISVEGYCAVNGRKETHWKKCKPFHESHIGKPWSEIPGGV